MLLMIDNYDSFTYNLVQYFGELGAQVHTVRNDEISVDDIADLAPSHLVISPGPCTPKEAGISRRLPATPARCRFSVCVWAIRALARPLAARWCTPSG